MKKRILGILLAGCLLLQGMPVMAAEIQENQSKAETVEEEEEEQTAPSVEKEAENKIAEELEEGESAAASIEEAEVSEEEPTEVPTAEPTETPVKEESEEPSAIPSSRPTETPAEEKASEIPVVSPEETATVIPSGEPSVSPTVSPTATPTEEPEEVLQTGRSGGIIDAVYEYDFAENRTVLIATNVAEDEIVKASEDLPKIDTPSDAHWNQTTGDLIWKLPENGTGKYELSIYREGETQAIYNVRWNLSALDAGSSFNASLNSAALDRMTTGKYYFTVYALGNEEYGDSDICKSDTLDYVRPGKKLAMPVDLKWNGSTAMWNLPEGRAIAYVLAYMPEGESDFKLTMGGSYNRESLNAVLSRSFSGYMNEKGVYRFRIRALSGNIYEAVDSDWSDWSPEISTESLTSGIAAELTDLIEKNAGADDILNCLEQKNTDQLAVSLQSDETARAAIIKAEEKYANEKGITVTSEIADDMKGKISGDISIVGAAFNAGTDVSKMTLKLTQPTIEKEVDKQQYKNVVQINMTLDGAANTQNLKVPVRITMPIPAGVEASDLQILHYHNDGTMETIWPYISGNMASFTLTSFSTFVFANKADGALPFTDVETNKWSYAGIKFVYEKGIMTGVKETLFQPDASLTRGMFASIIYRLAGSPAVTYKNIFSDVPAGKWYSDAIIWAYENKIVAGLGNGKYGVYDNITREQMARMLMEYAKVQGYDTSGRADFGKFADASAVSSWAAENMSWAVESGIISGSVKDGKYYMNPKGQATRAEAATMLMKFIQKYE